MLFDKDYSFRGSHAEKVRELTSQFTSTGKARLFSSNINIYVLAPLIGFLYRRKACLDKSSNETNKIFFSEIARRSDDLQYNYRLIMLLDEKNELSFEGRLNKAFRYYGNECKETLADEQLYEDYVLGGVDVLYEKLIQDALKPEDYLKNLYDFVEEFEERYNSDVPIEDIADMYKRNSYF